MGLIVSDLVKSNIARDEKHAEQFIDQIISSVLNQTEFHKLHSSKEALKELQRYAKNFTPRYRINVKDKTFSSYESEVIFDNGQMFYVDVTIYKDGIVLNVFKPIK